MVRCFLAGLLVLTAAAHDEHLTLSFAETVQLVVRASREGFRPLKTFRIEMHPSRDYWYNVTNTLPGASQCRVFEHPQLVYRCEWARGKQTVAGIAAQIGAALGDPWNRADTAKALRFEPLNPRREGGIEIRQRGNGIEVTFYRPAGRDAGSANGIE